MYESRQTFPNSHLSSSPYNESNYETKPLSFQLSNPFNASHHHNHGATFNNSNSSEAEDDDGNSQDENKALRAVFLRLTDCELKTSRLITENRVLSNSIAFLEANLVNLSRSVQSLDRMYLAQQHVLEELQEKLSRKRKLESISNEDTPPHSDQRQADDESVDDVKPPYNKKQRKFEPAGLYEIRQRIPWRLNSGYVIHAVLCCALNGLGAVLRKDKDGKMEGIQVSSYWLVKACCIFIINNVLCKRSKSTDATTWDKSLKQHWFEGWVSKDEFYATAKAGKRDTLNELLQGHDSLSECEKNTLLEKVDSQPQF